MGLWLLLQNVRVSWGSGFDLLLTRCFGWEQKLMSHHWLILLLPKTTTVIMSCFPAICSHIDHYCILNCRSGVLFTVLSWGTCQILMAACCKSFFKKDKDTVQEWLKKFIITDKLSDNLFEKYQRSLETSEYHYWMEILLNAAIESLTLKLCIMLILFFCGSFNLRHVTPKFPLRQWSTCNANHLHHNLYTTLFVIAILDITRFKDGSQNCIDYIKNFGQVFQKSVL